MKLAKKFLLAVLLLFLVAQIVRPERSNPPVVASIDAPPEVLEILRSSCFDCHSNETAWPWYSEVAPISWLVAHDVEEGREHLNFSEWSSLDAEARRHLAAECIEELDDGEMPLWYYTPLHAGSAIDASELAVLRTWAATL